MKLMNLGVAVKETEQEEVQHGKILIPDTIHIKSKYKKGFVVEMGNGTQDREMEVHKNDVVMYKKAVYPESEGCEIISLDDILYICGRKCKSSECDNLVERHPVYCDECYNAIFED